MRSAISTYRDDFLENFFLFLFRNNYSDKRNSEEEIPTHTHPSPSRIFLIIAPTAFPARYLSLLCDALCFAARAANAQSRLLHQRPPVPDSVVTPGALRLASSHVTLLEDARTEYSSSEAVRASKGAQLSNQPLLLPQARHYWKGRGLLNRRAGDSRRLLRSSHCGPRPRGSLGSANNRLGLGYFIAGFWLEPSDH